MFTGIVEEVGTLKVREQCRLVFTAQKAIEGVAVGDSIAVNGACLTVTSIDHHNFSVDVMPETLRRTNLDGLKVGHKVNLERPLVYGGRVGGHLVQGHIDGTGWVKSIEPQGDARIMKIIAPPELMSFIVEKGFIAVDGVSLTVVERGTDFLTVSLVGYTSDNTNLSGKNPDDRVNLEVDIMAKYIKQLIARERTQIVGDFLAE